MNLQEGFHNYFIYIITNKAKTVFYTGVTLLVRAVIKKVFTV